MKKILVLFLTLLLALSFTSCSEGSNYVPKEQPVSYSEKIDVVITSIEKKQWFAGTVQRKVEVTVYSKKYNLTGKHTEHMPALLEICLCGNVKRAT